MVGDPQLDVTGRPVAPREVDLESFFRPKSVAVIGASDTARRPNTAMWKKIRAWSERFGAAVYPVNPRFDELDGLPCFASIDDVPGELDLAVILVGDAVPMFEQVLAKQPKFAVIFGAGFSEIGSKGERLENKLKRLIGEGDTHVLGPNTNLNAFETFRDDIDGPAICLITQSGHQGRPVFQAQELGVRLSHWAPTGNEADLEFADFAKYFADLPDTGAIAAYIEGFKDGRTLMLAADHAAQAGVPIVCVKVGRTDEGASMAKSHTGHLTGSDRVIDDVFRQTGIIRVDGLDELTEVSTLLARTKPPIRPGRRNVCVYSISGGTGAHMADMVADAGLSLPSLSRLTTRELREYIPGYLRVSNPVDSGGAPSGHPEKGPKILDAILADPKVDMLIVPITGALESMSLPFTQHLVEAAEHTDKPVLVVWGSPTEGRPYNEVLCSSDKLATFRTFANCVTAAKAYFDHHDFVAGHRSPFAKAPKRRSKAAAEVEELLARGGSLSEYDSKQVLAAYGIPVTRDVLATSADLAAKAARKLKGPVVMKIASADIAHKSDLGLVKVGVEGGKAVRETFEKLVKRARKRAKGAKVDGVLVCEMVEPGGVEAMVGVSRDELFGPTVAYGLGGVFVEVFEDIATRVPPFDRTEARRMIDQTRGSRLLHGTRGSEPLPISDVVDVIMGVQRLAVDFADEISEIDINPLVVRPDGVIAVDGLIVVG